MSTYIHELSITNKEEFTTKLLKRFFDILVSISVLLIFSWLYILVAIVIKLSSSGPVFFIQKRTGHYNEEFDCYKFRTMHENPNADFLQATPNDPRLTRIGGILRKLNIDELPQFWNVLIGNMSIVGPRPHMLKHTKEFSALIDNYLERHDVKPGITGLAQVMGYRGETKELYQIQNRVKLDIWYIQNMSLKIDLMIVGKTILQTIKEIYQVVKFSFRKNTEIPENPKESREKTV